MITLKEVISHSIRIRCPRCGAGKLFVRWGDLAEKCEVCSLRIKEREPDTWFFMYISTAGITGLFVLSMLSLPAPRNQFLGSLLIGLGALCLFVITTPLRKSMAIGWEYFTDAISENPKFPDEK